MKNEAAVHAKFGKMIKKAAPKCFYYKIPDTLHLGGKKPFDSILILRGVPFAIEFKMKGNKATPYQEYKLEEFEKAGGLSKVFTYGVNDFDEFINGLMQEANMLILAQPPLFNSNADKKRRKW